MRFDHRSLRVRMLAAFLVPALVSLGGLIGLTAFAARDALEAEVGARLQSTAAAAAALMPTGLIDRLRPDSARTHANLKDRLDRVAERVGARRVLLVGLDGRSLVDTAPDAPPPGAPDRTLAQDRFELERVAAGETAASVLYTGLDGVRYKRGYAPVRHQGQVIAALGVEGRAENYETLDALQRDLLALGALALVALTIIVMLLARALTAPLARLAEAAARIGAGALEAPIGVSGGASEIRVLARTMDEMRDALGQREREMQMMLGGIAHEVRNPLGGMELFVGLLRDDLDGRDDELELLERVEHELGVLKRIVEEFLSYARNRPIDRAPFALAALAAEVDGLVEVAVGCPADATLDGATLDGDREQLRRLVLNLARNAAQAGATRVELIAWAEGAEQGFEVVDDGGGLPPEVAAQAFDAFFTTREKGTGLGLALCRKIARAHGGRITLVDPGPPGARFRVVLPPGGSSPRAGGLTTG